MVHLCYLYIDSGGVVRTLTDFYFYGQTQGFCWISCGKNHWQTTREPLGNLSETSWSALRNLSDTSREPLGNFSGTSRKPIGNLSGTPRKVSQEVSERSPRGCERFPRGPRKVSERPPRGSERFPRACFVHITSVKPYMASYHLNLV